MGAFLVLSQKQTPKQAWENFQNLPLLFLPYRDITPGVKSYKCSILHCLQVLYKSLKFSWIRYSTFDVVKYRKLYSIDNGDITWLIPHKIAVFSSPASEPRDFKGLRNYTPEDYSAIFSRIGIKTVIKLDGNFYDFDRFTRNGINFYDLSFKGKTPPMNIVSAFLEIVENSEYSVAVHCKSGLGKSPTLVSVYAMKKFDITAEEFIAWARICRPGSIIGQQQEFVKQMENKCTAIRNNKANLNIKIRADNFSLRKIGNSPSSVLDFRGSMKKYSKTSTSRKTSGSLSKIGLTPRSNKPFSRLSIFSGYEKLLSQ